MGYKLYATASIVGSGFLKSLSMEILGISGDGIKFLNVRLFDSMLNLSSHLNTISQRKYLVIARHADKNSALLYTLKESKQPVDGRVSLFVSTVSSQSVSVPTHGIPFPMASTIIPNIPINLEKSTAIETAYLIFANSKIKKIEVSKGRKGLLENIHLTLGKFSIHSDANGAMSWKNFLQELKCP